MVCDVAGCGGWTYRGDWQMERARDGRARRVRNCMAAEILVGRESRVLAAAIGRCCRWSDGLSRCSGWRLLEPVEILAGEKWGRRFLARNGSLLN